MPGCCGCSRSGLPRPSRAARARPTSPAGGRVVCRVSRMHVKLSMLDLAFHAPARRCAAASSRYSPQLGRSLRPVGFPGEREFDQVALCIGGIQRHTLQPLAFAFEIGSESAVVLAAAPEAVPALLRKVAGSRWTGTWSRTAPRPVPRYTCAWLPKLLHELFQSRVLPQSLDESPNRIQRRVVHLLFQILIMARARSARRSTACSLQSGSRVALPGSCWDRSRRRGSASSRMSRDCGQKPRYWATWAPQCPIRRHPREAVSAAGRGRRRRLSLQRMQRKRCSSVTRLSSWLAL